ncbi:MAG: ATPase family associated with various cellular [Bacteroidetes bacterium]|nr:ATPase family associated with various cellular [Bacteroidota bacterium]
MNNDNESEIPAFYFKVVDGNESINARVIRKELEWLVNIIRFRNTMQNDSSLSIAGLYEISPPEFTESRSDYYSLLKKYDFDFAGRFTLIFSLAIHIVPRLFDAFKFDKPRTEFGGISGKNHRGFIPTGETLIFVLAGNDLNLRLELLKLFDKDHVFYKDNLVYLETAPQGEPELSGVLTASPDFIDLALRGKVRKPDLRPDFPAKLLSTEMEWNDVVLTGTTRSQLSEIELWILHNQLLLADPVMGKKLKPGFRALFYGPPGTGKTLSACLIGKKTGRDVYRVDLSTIVSKYIGETEKNLAKLFDRASRKDWILFFDEADALFGKRTDVNDSHDRYANQEVSYLLQRIEYHEGLVILATNMKNNIDSAFLRRFQSIVYFPMPKQEERLLLWKKAFSESIPADAGIDLEELARKYELSGSLISNIVSHTTLRAFHEKGRVVTFTMLQDGIARELAKEGRTL